jgi:hypothetical protein
MLAVFIPALILEVFTTYFIIKTISFKLPIDAMAYLNYFLWNLFLVVPSLVAVYIGAVTTSQGRRLPNQIGKYSNYCNHTENFHRVINF